jgi:triosephosphate isomerase
MRRPVVAGNWKMNGLQSEAEDLVKQLIAQKEMAANVDVILAPPFTALALVQKLVDGSGIQLAGQNIHFEPKGAWTGEISAAMLKDSGCKYVILGHSERRSFFHEDDALINKKIKAALKDGLHVIFCVGETLEQRERNETRGVVESQLNIGMADLTASDLEKLIIAYEPVWAIGTGKTATPEQAQEVHEFTRAFLETTFGKSTAESTRIQYGGSVNSENSKTLMAQKDIDGALVGSASLNAESFIAIINSTH